MHIPSFFQVKDMEEIKAFIQSHSFATVVTTTDGKPIATHIPVSFLQIEDSYVISGHMAIGNPQWKTLEENEQVLVIFQGPHAYISSSWYEKEAVPTWNYQAVHVYGKAKLLEKSELVKELTTMLETYESHREQPVLWHTLSDELLEKQMKGIVGFKIIIDDVQAAFKLSQNRHERDYAHIIEKLEAEGEVEMAKAMKEKVKDV
ncbi:FMN-binding negative transcriptional regulator [Bacillus pumilus]|uniref:FMN-binding negative transcriptional regulator n=1 Tax=Bacillus pumilus TaxID=1408 RepID=UPI00209E4191|nr:FMN-binding negative transcriptional regulator [Bacillus pumilus]MCP1531125.1 transcriptional regulator [Bacillus pumilus]MCW4682243.1 FMN-binding negative transcriptional regulator [Bacillus pumilus]MCY7573164.1 FMN-binding negative transcriptional regulator [Bacillus pumilus]MDF9786523.1 transcriptional regulator [Bacillus pumilus]MEC3760448.1 FMN-binding negative transcriptional regulator [Bacillus pumilus]